VNLGYLAHSALSRFQFCGSIEMGANYLELAEDSCLCYDALNVDSCLCYDALNVLESISCEICLLLGS
jgi:hypothetical protein